MYLALALAQLVVSRKVAIVLVGSPRLRSTPQERKEWYRCLSDGMRMATIFEANDYEVHCVFSESSASVYHNNIKSIGSDRNWMRRSNGELFKSIVSDAELEGKGEDGARTTILNRIRKIDLASGDQVAVYVRSHGSSGHNVGLMDGVRVFYGDIINAIARSGIASLWIFDACYSGGVLECCEKLFPENSIVITSTNARCPSVSDWPVEIEETSRHQISPESSSWFRHYLIRLIQGGRENFPAIVREIRNQIGLPVHYRTFGQCREDCAYWIENTCNEPDVDRTSGGMSRWDNHVMADASCDGGNPDNNRPVHHKSRRHQRIIIIMLALSSTLRAPLRLR